MQWVVVVVAAVDAVVAMVVVVVVVIAVAVFVAVVVIYVGHAMGYRVYKIWSNSPFTLSMKDFTSGSFIASAAAGD